mgnify:CR=1 FL=1
MQKAYQWTEGTRSSSIKQLELDSDDSVAILISTEFTISNNFLLISQWKYLHCFCHTEKKFDNMISVFYFFFHSRFLAFQILSKYSRCRLFFSTTTFSHDVRVLFPKSVAGGGCRNIANLCTIRILKAFLNNFWIFNYRSWEWWDIWKSSVIITQISG